MSLNERKQTVCWFCGSDMIWGSDYDFEDYGITDAKGIVAFLSCTQDGCETSADFFNTIKESEENNVNKPN